MWCSWTCVICVNWNATGWCPAPFTRRAACWNSGSIPKAPISSRCLAAASGWCCIAPAPGVRRWPRRSFPAWACRVSVIWKAVSVPGNRPGCRSRHCGGTRNTARCHRPEHGPSLQNIVKRHMPGATTRRAARQHQASRSGCPGQRCRRPWRAAGPFPGLRDDMQEVSMNKSMRRGLPLAGILAVAALSMPAAHADISVDDLHGVLERSAEYGFTYYKDIEIDDDGSVEVEGWLAGNATAKVTFSAQGAVVEDRTRGERERKHSMQQSDVRAAVQAAAGESLTRVEDVQINRKNVIEVEGQTAEGKDI